MLQGQYGVRLGDDVDGRRPRDCALLQITYTPTELAIRIASISASPTDSNRSFIAHLIGVCDALIANHVES